MAEAAQPDHGRYEYVQHIAPLPDGPIQVVMVGRKGRGKTELAYQLWDTWEGDRLVIDVTGDVGALHPEEETVDLASPVPSRWPTELKDADNPRLSLRYVPDRALSVREKLEEYDRLCGMCFEHGNTLLWIDDAASVIPVHNTGPQAQVMLEQSRHGPLWLMITAPRPKGINVLALANADVVYAFQTPNADDQVRLADAWGHDRRFITEQLTQLEPYHYIRYHAAADELALLPPIPLPHADRRRYAERHIRGEDQE